MMTNNTPIQSQTVDHLMMANKAANKVTKVRRTRQPRNPQLSVARRNERERNRVKMVNNGFALLREHLPVEDLAACEQSGSDTPTPDGGSQAGAKSKAKKFSKVETLRAAIQRIKVLEELIRSTDPTFESMNIGGQQVSGMFIDEEPFSVCEPLSISSSNSASTMHNLQDIQNQQAAIYGQREQFIKLEPQQQQQQPLVDMPSPQDSHTSNNCGLNQHHQHRYSPAASSTQVHHLSQHHHHQEPSHTHLWIQQHQNSFIEQQQQQQYQQQQMSLSETTSPTNNHWFAQRQQVEAEQKSNWFIQQQQQQHNETAEPEPTSNQLLNSQHQSPSSQQSLQVDSPVWFNNSPGAPANQVNSNSQPMQVFGQHHQISLYSQ